MRRATRTTWLARWRGAKIFAAFYAWASQRPKPLMIAEYGDQSGGPGERAAWLDAAHAALVENDPYFNPPAIYPRR